MHDDIVRLYTPSYCIFCTILEPRLKKFCEKRGLELRVYKVGDNGIAKQVNGEEIIDATDVKFYPCVVWKKYEMYGLEILGGFAKFYKMEKVAVKHDT